LTTVGPLIHKLNLNLNSPNFLVASRILLSKKKAVAAFSQAASNVAVTVHLICLIKTWLPTKSPPEMRSLKLVLLAASLVI
jgi:hypothetical protein